MFDDVDIALIPTHPSYPEIYDDPPAPEETPELMTPPPPPP